MIDVSVTLKCDDSGLEGLKAKLLDLQTTSAKIGFWEEVKHPNGKLDSAALANILENGAKNIPARPFIEDGSLDSTIELEALALKQTRKFLTLPNASAKDALLPLAEVVSRWISGRILFNSYVDNAPSTVRKKGFNRPLYETGWLAENVQTKVGKK